MVVDVRCFAPNSGPGDHRFTILLVGARALPGRLAFLLSNDTPGSGTLDPATESTTGSLGAIQIQRDSAGYTIVMRSQRRFDSHFLMTKRFCL